MISLSDRGRLPRHFCAYILPTVLLGSMGGCAVTRNVRVESAPPGARVLHNQQNEGATPVTFSMTFERVSGAWVPHDLELALQDFETLRTTVTEPDVPKPGDAINVLTYELDRIRHRLVVPISSSPPGAQIFIDGASAAATTDASVPLQFSRSSSHAPWNAPRVSVRLADYEQAEQQVSYDQAVRAAKVHFELERLRWPLRLVVGCNVDGAEVHAERGFVDHAPCTVDLIYLRESTSDPWQPIQLAVRKDGYIYRDPSTGERYDSFQTSLLPDEVARMPELRVTLRRKVWEEMIVPIWEDTERGPVFRRKIVRSYVEDIEKEPKVKSVTRVTSYHPRELVAGRLAILPDSESVLFVVPNEVEGPDGVGRAGPLGNLWSKKALEQATTRLTDGDYRDLSPGVSADGQLIYFQSSRLQKPTLWRIGAKGRGGLTKITDSAALDDWPNVSPDGTRIAYVSRLRAGAEEHIWVANADGTLPAQIREGRMPCWSPDGTRIAFVAADPTTKANKLWIMDADGASPTQITSFPESDEQCPAWHPNGRQIVFASNRARDPEGDPNYDIWIANVDGTGQTQLTVNGSDDIFPAVSPNGRYVYFYSYRGLRTEVWRIELPDELVAPSE